MAEKPKKAGAPKRGAKKAPASKVAKRSNAPQKAGDLSELVKQVLAQDYGLLVTELLPYVNEALAENEKIEQNAINENGLAAILDSSKDFEVVEGTSRWRLKK